MFAKSSNELVNLLKRWTRNIDQVDQSGSRQEGINQSYVLFALNEGKNSIQQALCNVRQELFLTSSVVTISALSTSVPAPARAIGQTRIRKIEFSETTSEEDYRTLKRCQIEDYVYSTGSPLYYTPIGTQIKIWPIPSSGYLRFWYQEQDNDMDLRRSVVKTGGMVNSGSNLQYVNVDETNSLYDAVNLVAMQECDAICISSYDGTVLVSNIPVASFDATNKRFVVESGFAYSSGQFDGKYISCGMNSCIRSALPTALQDYVIEWAKYRLQNWDASDQTPANIPILQARKAELMDLFSDPADEETISLVGSLTGNWSEN